MQWKLDGGEQTLEKAAVCKPHPHSRPNRPQNVSDIKQCLPTSDFPQNPAPSHFLLANDHMIPSHNFVLFLASYSKDTYFGKLDTAQGDQGALNGASTRHIEPSIYKGPARALEEPHSQSGFPFPADPPVPSPHLTLETTQGQIDDFFS